MAAKRKSNATPSAEIEVVDKPGLGIDEGIVLGTFFLLVAAVVLVYMANQTYLA
ncbi:MAG: hypothetical protein KDE27_12255 [Planctomycetes bacterium]|nr:hypothetical protein [Planctomycetota bacterium]